MKIPVALLATAIALGVASCGGTTSQPASSTNDSNRNIVAPTPGSTANKPLVEDAPPADAQFTLFCDAIRGPNHVITATALKEQLITKTGMRSWHLVHSNDQSAIYYGYYRTFNDREHDPAEADRAQADLKKIEGMKNAQGDRLFPRALFLAVNNPDPDAPAQWNLTNTPPSAFWSLQIGAYENSPERKKYAVEAVRGLRSQGVEAYYYHGDTISSVCVGAWPMEAVKRQDTPDAQAPNPEQPILVLSGQINPINTDVMRDKEGHHLTVEAPKLEILDGTMKKAIRDYPEHAVNGEVLVRTLPNGQKIPSPSFLVLIPHSDAPPPPMIELPQPKETVSNGAAAAANSILDDAKPTQPDRGHLRGVEQP